MQVLQAPQPCAQAVIGRGLLDSAALGADLLGDPVSDGWKALQQVIERAGCA